MKTRLRAAAAKFATLQPREKYAVAVAALVVVGFGGYSLGVEPAQRRAAQLKQQLARQKADLQSLQAQAGGLKAQLRDPDAANKKALAATREQLAISERALRRYDDKLVPPERMPQLLQSVFARHRGVELVSLQTLPPAPLLASRTDAKAQPGAEAKTAPEAKGGNIHKHGLEIKMAGNYLDLLAYVTELERLPQKLLWGRMSLATTTWPRSELTLTVYTLSLEPTWMVV